MITKFATVRLSVKFRSVFFPLSAEELTTLLAQAGYEIQMIDAPSQSAGRLEVTGPVATKGNAVVDLNMQRSIIGVTSRDLGEALGAFEDIAQLLKQTIDLNDWVWFYEAILAGTTEGDEPAVSILRTLAEDSPIFSKISDVWGRPLTNFGLRLIPVGQVPNQEEWVDIKIEPDVRRAAFFTFEAVSRSATRETVTSFTERLVQSIEGTVALMHTES